MGQVIEVVDNDSSGLIKYDDAQIDLFFKMHKKNKLQERRDIKIL